LFLQFDICEAAAASADDDDDDDYYYYYYYVRIVSDRRPETKQGIEGKIVRFRSGRVRVRDKDCRSEPDRRSEAISYGAC